MFSKIIVSSPWYYFALSLLAGLAVALWLYYKNKKNTDIPRNVLWGMTFLRFASTSLIAFLLLGIFLKRVHNEKQNPVVLLAIDNSSSITAMADSQKVKTAFVTELEALRQQLAEKFEVKTILFGSSTHVADNKPDFSEKETDLANLVYDLDNNYANQNVGALILVSDGIYNKGASPVYAAERLNYPVYTVAMGDTSEPRDVMVQKVNRNQVAYLGNNFPVEVIVKAKKYSGKEVTVSLLRNGAEKAKQTLKINGDDFLATCNFTLAADAPGLVKYTAKVSQPGDEKNSDNNAQSFIIEVIDNREKVLLLATVPHPDIAAIKDAISNSTAYELEYAMAADFKKPLKAYSLIIIHGFSPAQLQLVNDCKSNNIPYWIVNPNTFDNLPGLKVSGDVRRANDAEPIVNNSFGLFTLSEELKKLIKDLPAVKVPFGNYSLTNSAGSLINQRIGVVETENPILLFNEQNGLKTGAFVGDGLWKWKTRDFEEHNNQNLFNELISKCVQYLSVKSDKSFFRITAPKIINENEALTLGAEVYNKSYELITDSDVTLDLVNADHKKFSYTFSKASNAYRLNVGLLPPGEYSYEARVKNNGEVMVKRGIVLVKEVIAEKLNTVANHQLLFQLSKRSNGKLFYPNQLNALQNDILKSDVIKPITYSQTSTSPLIDLKWLFWLVLAFLALEWFFRKRFTSI